MDQRDPRELFRLLEENRALRERLVTLIIELTRKKEGGATK
jgi:hypothetical protein